MSSGLSSEPVRQHNSVSAMVSKNVAELLGVDAKIHVGKKKKRLENNTTLPFSLDTITYWKPKISMITMMAFLESCHQEPRAKSVTQYRT